MPSEPAPVTRRLRRVALLALALAGLAFLPYLLRLFRVWWANLDIVTLEPLLPGLFVGPLVLVLLVRVEDEFRRSPPDRTRGPLGRRATAWLLVGGLGCAALAALFAGLGEPFWAAPLLGGWAWPLVRLGRGSQVAQRWTVPLLLLALLPPLPGGLLGLLQPRLSLLGASAAELLARLVGLQPQRTGHVVRTDQFYIQVIDACSGLYMALMFLIVTLTLLQLRRWHGRGWLAVLLAVPCGLVLNSLRLGTLLVLGHHDPILAQTGAGHDLPGGLLFGLGVLLLGVLGERLGRDRSAPRPGPAPASSGGGSLDGRGAA